MRFSLIAAALAATVLLTGCDTSEAPPISVENGWVRLPAVAGRPGAAYFTVSATRPDVLLEVTTPATARTEMHETMDHGAGMAAMRPLETFALGRGETRFEPGGKHVMLYEIDPAVTPGGAVELTLRFSQSPPVTVQAATIGAGDPPPGE